MALVMFWDSHLSLWYIEWWLLDTSVLGFDLKLQHQEFCESHRAETIDQARRAASETKQNCDKICLSCPIA